MRWRAGDGDRRAAERASDLTRKLLTFSRNQPMQLRRFDLNRLLTDLTPMLKRLIGEDITVIKIVIGLFTQWRIFNCRDIH